MPATRDSLEQLEIAHLAVAVDLGVRDEHVHAAAAHDLLDSAGDVDEERVAEVGEHQPDRRAAPRRERSRGVVAHEAEFGDRTEHLAAGALRHLLGTVERVRHGADRDARHGARHRSCSAAGASLRVRLR